MNEAYVLRNLRELDICGNFKIIVTCVFNSKLCGGGFDLFLIQETAVIYRQMLFFGWRDAVSLFENCLNYY